MQIARDAFALIFPDGDLGEDLFPLQAHVAAVVPDDGNEEIDNNNCYDQSEKQRNIQDLIFHLLRKNTCICCDCQPAGPPSGGFGEAIR